MWTVFYYVQFFSAATITNIRDDFKVFCFCPWEGSVFGLGMWKLYIEAIWVLCVLVNVNSQNSSSFFVPKIQ